MPSPQKLRWAKLRITVLAISAASVLTVLVYLLSGGTWLKPKVFLTTYIPDSTGLEPDADVQLNGVKVGVVASVHLSGSKDPNRVVEVRMKVENAFLSYIPDDSVTGLDSANMLGDEYVDITMGRSPTHVHAESVLRFPPPSSTMQNIDMRQFDQQLRTIDTILQDMQAGKGPLGQFMVDDGLYRQFLDGVAKVETQMHAATGSQSELGQALYSSAIHDNLVGSLQQLDNRIGQMQASGLFRDTKQYDQIQDQLAQIHRTLADLHAGKGSGGQMLESDEAYTAWNRMLAQWITNADSLAAGEGAMGHLLTSAETYESLNGRMRELGTTMKEFRADPRKYLRLKLF